MFKSIGANKDGNKGKFSGEQSKIGKSTQWTLGDAPHEPAKTVTATDFGGFAGHKLERTMKIPQPAVSVHLGDTPTNYISNVKDAFVSPPDNFVKARPLKTRLESVKTNYSVSRLIISAFKYR